MCAGDLGMYRVMPWSYPPISGGTSGGFSTNPDQSEDKEPDTLVLNSDSSITIPSMTELSSDSSKTDRIRVYVNLTKVGLQNVLDLNSLRFTLKIESMEATVNSVEYNLKNLITNIEDNRTLTPPFDVMVNSTATLDFDYSLASTIPYSPLTNQIVSGSLVVDTLNADGEVIRTQSFPVSKGV